MGLYPIPCICGKAFLWWSGNLDARCPDCIKAAEEKAGKEADMVLENVDKMVNQTPLPCGHKPCQLAGCLGCDHHCHRGKHA